MLIPSKLEVRGFRCTQSVSLGARLALAGAIYFGSAARSEASPYYTVTDMGRESDIQANDSGYYNSTTGVSYAFTNRPTILTESDQANLPTFNVQLTEPPGYHEYQTFKMQPFSANDSGTVVGDLVKGSYRGNMPIYEELGYTVRSSDGTYSPFVPLSDRTDSATSQIYLNQQNQILINPMGVQNAGFEQFARLLDLNTGVTTPLTQLIPPEILDRYQRGVAGVGLDGRGDILVLAYLQNYPSPEVLMLTPPGLDAPAQVPEPSTLLIFAAAGTLAVREARRRGTHRARQR